MNRLLKKALLLSCSIAPLVGCGVTNTEISSSAGEVVTPSSSATDEKEPIDFKALDWNALGAARKKRDITPFLSTFVSATGVVTVKENYNADKTCRFYLQNGDVGLQVTYRATTPGKEHIEVGKTLTVKGQMTKCGGFDGEVALATGESYTEGQGEIILGGEASYAPVTDMTNESFASYFSSYVELSNLKITETGTFASRPSLKLENADASLSFQLHATADAYANEGIKQVLDTAQVGGTLNLKAVWLVHDVAKGRFLTLLPLDTLTLL